MRNARPRAVIVLLATLLLLLAGGVPGAFAHDQLVSSNPTAGATLERAPSQVVLVFNENVKEPAYAAVKVGSHKGTAAKARIEGGVKLVVDTSGVPASQAGEAAAWKVSFRIVSADGHPVGGEIPFTVDPKGESVARSATTKKASSYSFNVTWVWIAGAALLVVAVGAVATVGRRK